MWEVECPYFEMIKNQKILKEHQARIGLKLSHCPILLLNCILRKVKLIKLYTIENRSQEKFIKMHETELK